MGRNKYGAKKCRDYFGNEYDSEVERDRGTILLSRLHAGSIRNLKRQVHYLLIDKQDIEGHHLQDCEYIADFVYNLVPTGKLVVEDVKGYMKSSAMSVFSIKRKLMAERYGIYVEVVTRKDVNK